MARSQGNDFLDTEELVNLYLAIHWRILPLSQFQIIPHMKNFLISALLFTLLFHPKHLSGQISLLDESSARNVFREAARSNALPLEVAGNTLQEALDHVFDSLTSQSAIKGMSAAMLLPDSTLWKRSSGLASIIPSTQLLTPEHLLGMGSITKSFVATTLLLMIEDGLLTLDDSIGTYLEPYDNVPGNVTIRQLLSHRSGINDYLNENPAMIDAWLTYPDSIWAADSILHHYVLAPNFPVGTNWSYSNTNYLLAGRIIEYITGHPWYVEVRERILDPYHFSHTFAYPYESYGSQPFAHVWIDADGDGVVDDLQGIGFPDVGLFSIAGSAGSLLSTPEDLVQFHRLVYGGYLLQDTTLEEMVTDYIQDGSGFEYGLGSVMFPLGSSFENHGHDGSILYNSIAFYLTGENMALAVMQNDDRLAVPGPGNVPFDLNYLALALLETYLNYSIPAATHDQPMFVQNYTLSPNPANDMTSVDFTLASQGHVLATLYRMDGGIVQANDYGWLEAGHHTLELGLKDIPQGYYLLSLQHEDQRLYRKLVVL